MDNWFLEKLAALPGLITGLAREKRELGDNALRAVSHALNETFIYYRNIELGKDRDFEIEAQLAKYWSAAAIPMRHVDSEFAEICEYKSQYWIQPERWSKQKIKEFRIGLHDVQEHYRRLLRKQSFVNKINKNTLP